MEFVIKTYAPMGKLSGDNLVLHLPVEIVRQMCLKAGDDLKLTTETNPYNHQTVITVVKVAGGRSPFDSGSIFGGAQ